MSFPKTRLRRLRKNPILQKMVTETTISLDDLIMPLFVCSGSKVKKPIGSMPGNYQMSVDNIVDECKQLVDKGIKAVLLFGIPAHKDETGMVATSDDAIVQQAIKAVKKEISDIFLIADICNCEYTTHGHCGTIVNGDVDNDLTLETLALQALSFARAGVDMVAPSDMMDGRVGRIRLALDDHGFSYLPIMSYSAKYASAFYGPFREAAESAPKFGNRSSYQMNPANSDEAMREIALDIEEGADIIMVKPALSYLDVIRRAKDEFNIPIAAYNVSGEFSMVKAAAEKGWIDEKRIVREILTSIKRAGSDIILTYHARDMAEWL
ncbi:MAG: delta-aminolevulinic acid dehydratase [Bacteroidetes bacterium GWE2_41_25]|nr:MAG: delta-aminolevulinic acid dehydratase [Bacteroidetes bacterium GWA2_40_15]OFX91802.1 MAG: delta-aminolevulinic acid dehydratase [Bacteroidetes bacterium GWE2_41_25]OFX94064.1 MAG: delta-aminolevulinic acid dehydratase [Bacteroidetes bacterium GWC2_40_22]OFY58609.1 MAG: delta-aminolevulinic acid dehydratase [Bacteroidetes bacterium GWF2_41_9]HBH85523.1 porphobilinogen synthase [Bacteroidales bacterium]HCT84649.1 porphobilinogen synthase [Candidatus Margulisiibacteriota bacterium]